MREKLHILYQLQDLDRKVAQRTRDLKSHPVLEEFKALKESYLGKKSEMDALQEELNAWKKKMKKAEMHIHHISHDIKELKGKLYSGEISSTKELSQYEKKVQGKEKEKNSREEELLALMEEVELEEERIAGLRQQLKKALSHVKEVQNQGMLEINRLKGEIEELNRNREDLRRQADPLLLEQYDRDAGKLGGFVIARVKNNMCEGCRVFLSSSVLSILDNPGVKLKCENCGRILLKD